MYFVFVIKFCKYCANIRQKTKEIGICSLCSGLSVLRYLVSAYLQNLFSDILKFIQSARLETDS